MENPEKQTRDAGVLFQVVSDKLLSLPLQYRKSMGRQCSGVLDPATLHLTARQCRKIGGGPFQAFPDVVSKDVTFYDNKEQLRYEGLPKDSIGGITFLRLSKVGERAFCVDCHATLAMRYKHEYETIGLTLATVDEKTVVNEEVKQALTPRSHIFTSQNPWWYDPKMDGLPVHERFSGDFEQRMKASEGKEG